MVGWFLAPPGAPGPQVEFCGNGDCAQNHWGPEEIWRALGPILPKGYAFGSGCCLALPGRSAFRPVLVYALALGRPCRQNG